MENQPLVYSFEGGDGSGKHTQAVKFYDWLDYTYHHSPVDYKRKLELVSFPNYDISTSAIVNADIRGLINFNKSKVYGSYIDRFIDYQLAVSSLYALNRYETLKNVTADTMVCDRYTSSNMIHRGADILMNDGSMSDVFRFCKTLDHLEHDVLGLPRPSMVFYLDVPPEVSMRLILSRNRDQDKFDRYEQKDVLEAVHNVAMMLAEKFNWITIECCHKDGTIKNVETIHQMVLNNVCKGEK